MNLAILIEALVVIESGGDPAAVGDNGKALGILQIHEAVVQDVNRLYRKNYVIKDAFDPAKAREICRLYLTFWAMHFKTTHGRDATIRDLARIWNGGPTGWYKAATLPYWAKVEKALSPTSPTSTRSISSIRSTNGN